MRRLYLLRHVKSSWPQSVEDKDRPLSEEGKQDAMALAAAMKERGYVPDIVLCSPAKRTRQTSALVYQGDNIVVDHRLYLASTGLLYESLQAVDDKYKNIMMVGHNPGIHGLVQLLVGEGEQKLIAEILSGYKPGCLSVVECDCALWSELLPGGNRLADLLIGEQLA